MVVEKTKDYTVYRSNGYDTVAVRTETGIIRARKLKNESVEDTVRRLGKLEDQIILSDKELLDLLRAAVILQKSKRHNIHVSALVLQAIADTKKSDIPVEVGPELDELSTVADLLTNYCSWIDSSQNKTRDSKSSLKSRAKAAIKKMAGDNLGTNAYEFIKHTKLPPPGNRTAGCRAILLYGMKKLHISGDSR